MRQVSAFLALARNALDVLPACTAFKPPVLLLFLARFLCFVIHILTIEPELLLSPLHLSRALRSSFCFFSSKTTAKMTTLRVLLCCFFFPSKRRISISFINITQKNNASPKSSSGPHARRGCFKPLRPSRLSAKRSFTQFVPLAQSLRLCRCSGYRIHRTSFCSRVLPSALPQNPFPPLPTSSADAATYSCSFRRWDVGRGCGDTLTFGYPFTLSQHPPTLPSAPPCVSKQLCSLPPPSPPPPFVCFISLLSFTHTPLVA